MPRPPQAQPGYGGTPVRPVAPTRPSDFDPRPRRFQPRPPRAQPGYGAPTRPPSSGGGGGGGGGGGNDSPPPVQESSPAPTRWDDASYNAQIAALNRALGDFETGLSSRVGRYGEDFTRGVRDLGFRASPDFVPAPDILSFGNLEEGLAAVRRPSRPMARGLARSEETGPMSAADMIGGEWDLEGEYNPFSAAARGTRSSRDDFAGRGTLRSSDFIQSFAEFQDRLNQQFEAMQTGRGRFLEDSLTNLAQQRATTEERRQAARRDAVARAAMIDASRR